MTFTTISGSTQDDTLTGSSLNDSITGLAGHDTLAGGDGNDNLIGGRGNDQLIGGDGLDLALFSGNGSGYTVLANIDGSFTVKDRDAGDSNDGTDTLWQVEGLRFADGTSFALLDAAPPAPLEITQEFANPSVAVLHDGGYALAWSLWPDATGSYSVFVQVFDRAGVPTHSWFAIEATPPTADVFAFRGLAATADGGFVVGVSVWNYETGPDGYEQIQSFDSAGSVSSAPFTAWESGSGEQPILMLADGNVLLLRGWDNTDGEFTDGVFGRLYSRDGAAAGPAFRIDESDSFSYLNWVEAISLADGGFVVAWSEDQPTAFLRTFNADGTPRDATSPLADLFPDNEEIHLSAIQHVSLSAQNDGSFVAAWSRGHVTGERALYAQQYDNQGTPSGKLILVTREGNGIDSFGTFEAPQVAALTDTGFIVTWIADGSDLVGRRYDESGRPSGPELLVGYGAENAYQRDVDATADGGFLVTWLGWSDAAAQYVIQMQRFDAFGNPVHAVWSLGDDAHAIAGTALDELVLGNALDNTLQGNDGNDALQGFNGADTLLGGRGNDTLDGGSGADHMEGGRGNDLYLVDDVGDTVVEASRGGFDWIHSRVDLTLVDNVEAARLLASSAARDATGNALNNQLVGNEAANRLDGGAGNDTLNGGNGSDTLVGNSGNDWLSGGNGQDVARFAGAAADYSIHLDDVRRFVVTDNNILDGDDGIDTLTQIETIEFADGTRVQLSVADAFIGRATGNYFYIPVVSDLPDGGHVVFRKMDLNGDYQFLIQRYSPSSEAVGQPFVYDIDNDWESTISATNDGSLLVAWSNDDGVFLQHLPLTGSLPAAVQIDGPPAGEITTTRLTDGHTLIAWAGVDPLSGTETWAARLFDASGEAISDTFYPEGQATGDMENFTLCALTDGGFAASWMSWGSLSRQINVRTFDADGTPRGDTIIAKTEVGYSMSMASLADGGFVISADVIPEVVTLQIFAADGMARSPEISAPVNDGTGNTSVIGLSQGGFVVVSESSSGALLNIQRYDNSGAAIGEAHHISTGRINTLETPIATALADGGFVVLWSSDYLKENGNLGQSFHQLRFDAHGDPQHATTRILLGDTVEIGNGTALSDYILGNKLANTLAGGDGHDTLAGNGGADVLIGGNGNDVFLLNNLVFASIQGGDGDDTLRLNTAGKTLNLTRIADDRITGIERIDLTGSGDNTLVLDLAETLALTASENTLVVDGNDCDRLVLRDLSAWSYSETQLLGSRAFDYYTQADATLIVAQDVLIS